MEKRKTCFRCGTERALSDFYRHPQMADGHLNKCKDCTRQDAEKRRAEKMKDPQWMERERERHRKKAMRTVDKYPERHAARVAVRKLFRSKDFHWHHWSYLKEHRIDVMRLSAPDHRKAHTHMVYDQEQMKYRRCDNMQLLDTREEHEAYLVSVGCTIVEVND